MKSKVMISVVIAAINITTAFGMIQSPKSAVENQMLNHGAYVGVQAGFADMNYKKGWVEESSNVTSVGSVDNSGFSGRFLAGYNFISYLAVEMGYLMLPKVKFNDIALSGTSVKVDESFRQQIFDALVKVTIPLASQIDFFLKGGAALVIRDDIEASGGGVTYKSHTTNKKHVPVAGTGASYHFTKNLIADLSYVHYFENGDLEPTDFGSLGLIFQFG